MALGLLLGGCAGLPDGGGGGAGSGKGLFERVEVNLGRLDRPTVLTGFFTGGAWADVAVIDQGAGRARRLFLHRRQGDGWRRVLDAPLGSGVRFVDVLKGFRRDRLVLYEEGRVKEIDPRTGGVRTLVALPVRYRGPGGGELVRVEIARDVNGDQMSDLVVPSGGGFRICLQRRDGSFREPVAYGPVHRAEDGSRGDAWPVLTAETAAFHLGRVCLADVNGDGREDLALWSDGGFDVHVRDRAGRFNPLAERVEVPIAIGSDGLESPAGRGNHGTGASAAETVLRGFQDMNGDDVPDVVVQSLVGRSVFRKRSEYRVYLGERGRGGMRFSERAAAVIEPRGKAAGMQRWGYASQWMRDFDRDGDVDWLFRDVKVSLGGMAGTLVGQSVPIDLAYHPMVGGRYSEREVERLPVRRFAPGAGGLGRVFFPAVRVGDVDGDRLPDVVVGFSPGELRVYRGAPGGGVFARPPVRVAAELPDDEGKVRLVRLNRDARDDLLVHLPPTERDRSRGHRLTLWIARPRATTH